MVRQTLTEMSSHRNEISRRRTGNLQLFGSNDPWIDRNPYGNRSPWPLGQGAGGATPIPCANTAGVGPIKVGENTPPKPISFVTTNKWGCVMRNICKRRTTEAKIPLGRISRISIIEFHACDAELMRCQTEYCSRT